MGRQIFKSVAIVKIRRVDESVSHVNAILSAMWR